MQIASYLTNFYKSVILFDAIYIVSRPIKMAVLPIDKVLSCLFNIFGSITAIYDVLYFVHKLCDKVPATSCIVNHIWKDLPILARKLLCHNRIQRKTLDNKLCNWDRREILPSLLFETSSK